MNKESQVCGVYAMLVIEPILWSLFSNYYLHGDQDRVYKPLRFSCITLQEVSFHLGVPFLIVAVGAA
jgi:hypothetical protein